MNGSVSRRANLRAIVAATVATLVLAAACGGEERELVGYTRDPAPAVDQVALPDVSAGGAPFEFRGPAGGVLIVYFGYTNCPDVCPTTLANVRGAREELGDDAGRVELAMVTVDPDRDAEVLTEYVQGFVPGGHAVVPDDAARLRQAADSFGVSYQVTRAPNGEVQVAHTDHLFAVDESGTLVLTWPSGTSRADLAADLEVLLEDLERS